MDGCGFIKTSVFFSRAAFAFAHLFKAGLCICLQDLFCNSNWKQIENFPLRAPVLHKMNLIYKSVPRSHQGLGLHLENNKAHHLWTYAFALLPSFQHNVCLQIALEKLHTYLPWLSPQGHNFIHIHFSGS